MHLIEHYDPIVIAAGQVGTPLARNLANASRTTVLIQRQHLNGTCVNENCTPTETMVASARVAYLFLVSTGKGLGARATRSKP